MVGQRVLKTKLHLDQYGSALHSAVAVPGGGFTTRHDHLKWEIYALCHQYGNGCTTEVLNLFRGSFIPSELLTDAISQRQREMQGLVPDFMFQFDGENGGASKQRLGELKGIGDVPTHYKPTGQRSRTPFDAVNTRAAKLDTEYLKKAQKLDQ